MGAPEHEVNMAPVSQCVRAPLSLLSILCLGIGCSSSLVQYSREPQAYRSPPVDPSAPLTAKVKSLLAAMTLEEKRQLIHGNIANPAIDLGYVGQAGVTSGIPRLGIPARRDADALGINVAFETTAPPTRIGLAASFDRNALNEMGYLVGREGLARGVDVLYCPQIELVRLPNWARNNTTLGEDPYLAGELAAMEVAGVQGAGLMDNLKHFALYDGQPNRYSIVNDQVAHELYFAPFDAAITASQPASVMCSYAQIQISPVESAPSWACHSKQLLNVILRQQIGYAGLVLSDYTATHAADLQGGLDQEFATNFLTTDWLDSVKGDAAVVAAIDAAVARNLYQLERFGYLNCANAGPAAVVATCVPGPTRPSMDTLVTDHQAKAQRLAERSAVLLKNADNVLPLQTADLSQGVLVIGPAARYPLVGPGGERSKGFAARNRKGLAVALRELAPSAKLTYLPTIDWLGEFPPTGALTNQDGTKPCLVRDDFDGATTTPSVSCDAAIDYSTEANPIAMGHRYTWTGKLVAPTTGTYFLWVRLAGALPMFGSAATLAVDGTAQTLSAIPANANEFEDGLLSNGLALSLAAGAHDIVLSVANTGMAGPPLTPFAMPPTGPIYAQFRWAPYEAAREAALEAAKDASAVVIVANDATGNSTGMATTSSTILASLDAKQDELIGAIARVNPKTIVVLQNGQPVAMPWASSAAAILETWYPGQEGGYATANLLLGKVNPGGRLPVTFPVRAEDTPFAGKFEERVLGVPDAAVCGTATDCGRITWSEGLLVGYRWYDQTGTPPLFAFGEGLSYTTFSYSELSATPVDGGIDVTFAVKNTGARAGDAVPQVYLDSRNDVPQGVQVAKKSLVGFERIPLQPGETKVVSIHVSPRQLSYWSSSTQSWVPVQGKRRLHLSTSSRQRDVVDSVDVTVPAHGAASTRTTPLPRLLPR